MPASPVSRTRSSTCAAWTRSSRPSGTAGPRCGRRERWPIGPRQGIDPATVALAVVVQRMVDAVAAGVMFTANPTNGRRDETVIAAAWGLGTALARLGARIEDHFGAPQDVEWVRAGGNFWIVQSRPITALPEPEADPPTDWSVPDPSAFYVRASIVEQLPDPLCSLFADLVDGSVTRSLQSVLREFLGTDVVRDGDLGLPTINGYAYYRYGRGALG